MATENERHNISFAINNINRNVDLGAQLNPIASNSMRYDISGTERHLPEILIPSPHTVERIVLEPTHNTQTTRNERIITIVWYSNGRSE